MMISYYLLLLVTIYGYIAKSVDDFNTETYGDRTRAFMISQKTGLIRYQTFTDSEYVTELYLDLKELHRLNSDSSLIYRNPYLDFMAYFNSRTQYSLTKDEEEKLNCTKERWQRMFSDSYPYYLVPVDRQNPVFTKKLIPHWIILLQSAQGVGVGGYRDTIYVAINPKPTEDH